MTKPKKPSKTIRNAPKIEDKPKPDPIHVLRLQRIKRHKEQAEKWDGRYCGPFYIETWADGVSMIDSAGIRKVRYEVSDEEWERLTGWKS